MTASAERRRGRTGRIARRLAIGAALTGVVIAGNQAIGLADGDDDGREGSTVPGPPVDTPAPSAPVDSDEGRIAGAVAEFRSTSASELQAVTAAVAAAGGVVDNGRGGVDPAVGPLRVAQSLTVQQASDVGAFDTDSGVAPEPPPMAKQSGPNSRSASATAVAPSAPVDQDVPGAATLGTVGADLPSNDSDG